MKTIKSMDDMNYSRPYENTSYIRAGDVRDMRIVVLLFFCFRWLNVLFISGWRRLTSSDKHPIELEFISSSSQAHQDRSARLRKISAEERELMMMIFFLSAVVQFCVSVVKVKLVVDSVADTNHTLKSGGKYNKKKTRALHTTWARNDEMTGSETKH